MACEVSDEEVAITKKDNKPGVIYLSRVPRNMQVKKLREILSVYGELGRVFLQADGKVLYYRQLPPHHQV